MEFKQPEVKTHLTIKIDELIETIHKADEEKEANNKTRCRDTEFKCKMTLLLLTSGGTIATVIILLVHILHC